MKRLLFAIFILTSTVVYAQDSIDDLITALEESNKLLEQSEKKISALEAEVEKLTKDKKKAEDQVLSLSVALAEANEAIKQSNDTLSKAYDRIASDQVEIANLRNHIKDLIDSGVELQTYKWNIMLMSGYPYNAGMMVAFNFPWFPDLGVLAGFNYNFTTNSALAQIGVKINLK